MSLRIRHSKGDGVDTAIKVAVALLSELHRVAIATYDNVLKRIAVPSARRIFHLITGNRSNSDATRAQAFARIGDT